MSFFSGFWTPARVRTALIAVLFSGMVFFFLTRWVSLGHFLELFGEASKGPLVIAMLLNAAFPLLALVRWKGALDFCGLTLSWKKAVPVFFAAWPLSCTTPAKAGDLLKITAFDDGLEKKRALASLLVERLFDLPVLAALALAGYGSLYPQNRMQVGIGSAIFVSTLWILWKLLWPWVEARILQRKSSLSEVYRRMTFRSSGMIAGSSLIIWLFSVLQWQWVLSSFGVQMDWGEHLLRVPLCLLAGVMPLGWLGIGTRDMAFVLAYHQVHGETVLAASLVFTTIRYLVPGLLGFPWTVYFLSRQDRGKKTRK